MGPRWYRPETARLPSWDYGATGFYLVTVCTRERRPFLGHLGADGVRLTQAGRIVQEEWDLTPKLRPWLALDSLVVMPDHFHALLEISRSDEHVGPRSRWRRGVLGTVVNGVKAACTRRIRAEVRRDFAWQPRFHDVIIRSADHLARSRQYVGENPKRAWVRHLESRAPA